MRVSLFFSIQKGVLNIRIVSPAFRKSQSTLVVLAVSQVPLVQNNQYAKMVYLGEMRSELLQKQQASQTLPPSHPKMRRVWKFDPREGKRFLRRPYELSVFSRFPLNIYVHFLQNLSTWKYKSNKGFRRRHHVILNLYMIVALVHKIKDI